MTKQRHKYEYRVAADSGVTKVVRLVGAGKRVLELGSGPGVITRLLKSNQCRVTALELDSKAIEIVSQYCEKVHSCDLNDPEWPAILSSVNQFEVIVAGEVLEHLYDPWTTLRNLQSLLAEGGYVVVSLPHVGHNAIVACLLAGDFEYQPWGLLDKTHIRFFGMKNIQRLFNDAGFKIIEVDFVVRAPEQTEFAQRWRQLTSTVRQALVSNRFGAVYQVVVKAVPNSAYGVGLKLESQPVSLPVACSLGRRVREYLMSFLSLRMRQRISLMLERIGVRL